MVAFIFVRHHDRRDVRRRLHALMTNCAGLVIPQHDITLTAQFGRDRLNARAPRIPDTQAPTGSIRLSLLHCDFRTRARIASRRFYFLQYLLADFRHFDAEQFDQHFHGLGTVTNSFRYALPGEQHTARREYGRRGGSFAAAYLHAESPLQRYRPSFGI